MEIRKARPEDLDTAMALYDQGRRFMRQSGNHSQWINGYPSWELVAEDIRQGNCYLAEEDGRRKTYAITDQRREALRREYERLPHMVEDGEIMEEAEK